MLLRSSSSPILNSWIPPHYNHSCTSTSSKDSSPSPDHPHSNLTQLPRTKSISNLLTSSSCNDQHHRDSKPVTHKSDKDHHVPKPSVPTSTTLQRLFSSSGLNEVVGHVDVPTDEDGGGRGGGDGRVGGSGFREYGNNSNNGHGNVESYYQRMIEVNPGNSLLLGNYARFLKEVKGDFAKAEEYCGRAMLASPRDASMLSLYADIIWQFHKDANRAENYFEQAVKSAPDNGYVLASYAKFLWDVEEEEQEEGENQLKNVDPMTLIGVETQTPRRSPLTAA